MLLIHSYYLSTACVIFLIENLFSLLLQFPPSIFASLLALYVFPCLIDFFLVCLLTLSWAIPCLLSCLVVCFLLLALYVYLLALLLMCFRTPSKLSCYLALILALLCDQSSLHICLYDYLSRAQLRCLFVYFRSDLLIYFLVYLSSHSPWMIDYIYLHYIELFAKRLKGYDIHLSYLR